MKKDLFFDGKKARFETLYGIEAEKTANCDKALLRTFDANRKDD